MGRRNMVAARLPEAEFVEAFNQLGPAELARRYNLTERQVFRRRRSLEQRGIGVNGPSRVSPKPAQYPHRADLTVEDGAIIVASDAHYWPGEPSLMHRALVAFCKDLKPAAVVFTGDVIDAPTISRHPAIGWESRPQLVDEIEVAKERLGEIERAAFKAEKVWNLGNHDMRFETRLASVAPEYAKLHGVHLRDHFPNWRGAWSTWVNHSVVVKHRFKGGIHATHNNTLAAGKTMVTGHLHSAKVTPYTDYNGTRYGVDTGCIADPDHRAFTDYTEDNPKNWRSAFAVLTFRAGELLQPELVVKWDDESVQFRGEIVTP